MAGPEARQEPELALIVPEADFHREYRRSWNAAGFCAAVAVALGIWSLAMQAHERVLDEQGVETTAEIIALRDSLRGVPDVAVVQFSVATTVYRAELTVDCGSCLDDGQQIDIEYDPDHPDHARPLQGWDPSYKRVLLASAMSVLLAPSGILQTLWRERRDRRALASGRLQPALAAQYRRGRYLWHYGIENIVGLWPPGADGFSPPPHSVRLRSTVDRIVVPSGPVDVLGGIDVGNRVVLRVGGSTVWTNGKVRSGLPRRAKPIQPVTPAEMGWPIRMHPRDPRGRR